MWNLQRRGSEEFELKGGAGEKIFDNTVGRRTASRHEQSAAEKYACVAHVPPLSELVNGSSFFVSLSKHGPRAHAHPESSRMMFMGDAGEVPYTISP